MKMIKSVDLRTVWTAFAVALLGAASFAFPASALAGVPAMIYDNGPLQTGATSKSGVAAPAGFFWSELVTEAGSTFSNTTLGAGCQVIGTTTNNRCADDFNVPVGQSWTINTVVVYGYQTGSVTQPFVGGNLRIWNGRPGDPSSTIVFGDTTTNRLISSTDSTYYRVGNTLGGAGGVSPAATGTTRKIWAVRLSVSPALVLSAGNYWVDFQLDSGTTTGNFSPLNTINGSRSIPGWNARQFLGTTSTWGDLIDIGEPTVIPQTDVVPNVSLEIPFKLEGAVSGAPVAPASRKLDFDGDNKSDFAVARSASAAGQTTWWIRYANGGTAGIDFGLGVGITGGDKATPADFDGDGKTDVAVWRPGSALSAAFYILKSSTNTVTVDVFGQNGDDSSVVGDYDGDGKADVAVYRSGAAGVFYYRGSLNNPSGNISYRTWGTTGDTALSGDFDGDGKFDLSIYRNAGGLAEHWQSLSSGSVRVVQYGLPTDRFIAGDVDADGKYDLVAVRANAGIWDWYLWRSSNNVVVVEKFGATATDFLVPGDYDGDNRMDVAVWRSGQAADQTFFYVKNSLSSPRAQEWGQSSGSLTAPDYPVANFSVK